MEITYSQYSAELDKALDEYHALEAHAEALDPEELKTARLSLRPEEEKRAVSKVEDAYGNSYDYATMREAKGQVADLLGEEPIDSKPRSVRRNLKQAQERRYANRCRNAASSQRTRKRVRIGKGNLYSTYLVFWQQRAKISRAYQFSRIK